MKKLLSVVLSLALLGALAAPALGAEAPTAQDRLSQVTARVKARLDLDTSNYDNFHGDLEEGALVPTWSLTWSGEDGQLAVTALEDGRILSYRANDRAEPDAGGGTFGPAFPKLARAEARETARAFVDKALAGGVESAVFDEDPAVGRLSADSYRFTGQVRLNGLPSPYSFSVTVRLSDNRVTNFHAMGEVTQVAGDVPGPAAQADAAKAAGDLKGTLSLRLEYVLTEDGKNAVLRYLPNYTHDYYVDAATGALVDLTALYGAVDLGGADSASGAAPEAGEADKNMALTPAEQEGVAKLEGVLAKEALDGAARKHSALGLGSYTLAAASYTLDQESGDVSAQLSYGRREGERVLRRTVTVDARTGAVLAVSSGYRDGDGKAVFTAAAARAKAESFLREVCAGDFAKTALYQRPDLEREETGNVRSFTFAQRENGYFFPENTLTVSIDLTDGAVSGYSRSFDAAPVFQSQEGIVDAAAALDAWFATYDVPLGYRMAPEAVDLSSPEYAPLANLGQKYLYRLKLCWYLDQRDAFLGVDAKTGQAVAGATQSGGAIAYSDLEGSWAKNQVEALAAYGVGYAGGTFRPGAPLIQRDLVALLVSTRYRAWDPAELAEDPALADSLYDQAYRLGILNKADRADGEVLTRAETVKLLLDGAGYGPVVGLEGIFTCAYADAASIPAEYYGYAALAQGLGVIRGDKTGAFAPNRAATRGEAAVMLFNFMSR